MSTIYPPPMLTEDELAAFHACPDDAIGRKLLYDILVHRITELIVVTTIFVVTAFEPLL